MRTPTARKGRGGSFAWAAVRPGGYASRDSGLPAFWRDFWRPGLPLQHGAQLGLLIAGGGIGLDASVQRHDVAEGLSQLLLGHVLALNFQPLEERLVEQTALIVLGLDVGRLDVGREIERRVERGQCLVERDLKLLDQALGGGALALDALALLAKEAVADPIGVVGGEQLAFLSLQLSQTSRGVLELAVGLGADLLDVAVHGLAHGLPILGRQPHRRVVALDRVLDRLDAVVGLRAGVLLPPATDEIAVVVPGVVADPAEEQAPPALAAVEAAAQVVMAAPAALAALAP